MNRPERSVGNVNEASANRRFCQCTDLDVGPRVQSPAVELDGSERMLLDAPMKLKVVDPSLVFALPAAKASRSDAMNVNGEKSLGC